MDFVQPMIELLKLLGTLGAYSLAIALTAIIGMLVFKLTQLLSILLLIKYGILRLFDWMNMKKTTVVEKNIEVVEKVTVINLEKDLIMSTDGMNALRFKNCLDRIKQLGYKSQFLHEHHIGMLEEAVTWLEEKYHKEGKE